jgi:hypothetical protein
MKQMHVWSDKVTAFPVLEQKKRWHLKSFSFLVVPLVVTDA